jgi:hypothetical protein
MLIFSALLLLAAGCGTEPDAADTGDEQQTTIHHPPTETESDESTPTATDKVIWPWLDANIGSQERLATSRTGQLLSGADVGNEIQLASAVKLLFTEQLNLLRAIKKSRDIAVAKQYMLVHTLMTLNQAENTRSILPADDPRHTGVLRQITTAKELLSAIGYDRHLVAEESADQKSK